MAAEYLWDDDLLYQIPEPKKKCMRSDCPKEDDGSFAQCAKCGAKFCSRECLVHDWKKGFHKSMCPGLREIRGGTFDKARKRDAAFRGAICRVRLYVYPFYMAHRSQKGPGALFIQSPQRVEDFFFAAPVNRHGYAVDRQLFVAYVTPEEFDKELVPYDFEIALARAAFRRAVDLIDDDTAPALLKFRCGYVAVVRLPILDPALCRSLASDYLSKDQLQLNIDSVD